VNPGNYVDKKKFEFIEYSDAEYHEEIERIRDRFTPLIKICKEYGTALRIGTNHGSLSDRIMSRYGDSPMGMVESAMEFLRIARSHDYHDLILSMKGCRLDRLNNGGPVLDSHMAYGVESQMGVPSSRITRVYNAPDPAFFDRITTGLRRVAPAANVHVLTAPPVVGAALMGLDVLGGPRAAHVRVRRALTHERLGTETLDRRKER
jgi:hypothetical protein